MHLCFVDESGTPAKPGQQRPQYFVIAGLIIPEERWHGISQKLMGLKRQWKFFGELKWRYFAPQNDDHDNPMLGWDRTRRDEFRANVFNIVTGDRSVNIVAGVTQAFAAYQLSNVTSQSDIYFRTYKVVTERFQYLLQDISRASGRKANGIIVADHRGRGDDEIMRMQHQRLVEQDHMFTSTYGNLIEGLFLTPSHLSVGVQLSDMVAGAIGRKFESGDETWYQEIVPSLRKSSAGKVDGFGIARFPKNGWTGPIP
ncbi:MAG: DUF3800 domain-containing protein [Alphaproteobacteria bacterium]|nr:DUF3800 domain-containing protein [Alphaproteobacteria bacterium]